MLITAAIGHREFRLRVVFDCSEDETRQAGIAAACGAIQRGGLVVAPTETFYGMACDAFSYDATQRLRLVKGIRPDAPLPVVVGSWRGIDGLALHVSRTMRDLVEAFWPGPLSLIIFHAPSLRWDIGDTRGTVVVRMPLHPIALKLLQTIGPMVMTGANTPGQPGVRSALEAQQLHGNSVDVYLDGGLMTATYPSTIIDLTSDRPIMMREGSISAASISELLGTKIEVAE